MANSGDEVQGKLKRWCALCFRNNTMHTADVFCGTCDEFRCNNCQCGHLVLHVMNTSEPQILNTAESVPTAETTKAVDMKGFDICIKHNKRIKFYCEDHKVLACICCSFAEHRKCDRVPEITDIDLQHNCDGLKQELKMAITTMKNASGNLRKATSEIERIPEKLNDIKERFMLWFDDFADNVKAHVDDCLDKTTEQKTKCESLVNDMTESSEVIENVADNGRAFELFIIQRSMEEVVRKQIKDVSALCSELHFLDISCNIEPHLEELSSKLVTSLKQIEFGMANNVRIMSKTKLELVASVDLRQTGDEQANPLYTGLDFLSDDRLVAVDNNKNKCLLYDENLSFLSEYKLPYKHPYSVVGVSDEEVVITSGSAKRLDFLHVNASNQITFQRKCAVNVPCYSISIKDDDNFVVSTFDHGTPVCTVSKLGEAKNFDISLQLRTHSLSYSYCAYLRSQDKLVLTYRDANTIYFYETNTGKKVVVTDSLIVAPCGVALGPNDHVFVCCQSTGSIVEITPTGRVLSSHRVDIECPRYLAISKDKRRLAVFDIAKGSHKLKLYQIVSE